MNDEEVGYEWLVQFESSFATSSEMKVQIVDYAHQILHNILIV